MPSSWIEPRVSVTAIAAQVPLLLPGGELRPGPVGSRGRIVQDFGATQVYRVAMKRRRAAVPRRELSEAAGLADVTPQRFCYFHSRRYCHSGSGALRQDDS
jgi:hypothetical protein